MADIAMNAHTSQFCPGSLEERKDRQLTPKETSPELPMEPLWYTHKAGFHLPHTSASKAHHMGAKAIQCCRLSCRIAAVRPRAIPATTLMAVQPQPPTILWRWESYCLPYTDQKNQGAGGWTRMCYCTLSQLNRKHWTWLSSVVACSLPHWYKVWSFCVFGSYLKRL